MKHPAHISSRLHSRFSLSRLLLLFCLGVASQQDTSNALPLPPQPAPAASADCATSSPAGDPAAQLPTIPPPPRMSPPPLLQGVSAEASPFPSGSVAAPDPDAFKTLYGYFGPYYNTTTLDGRVLVLVKSLYVWPTSTWKASGMLRNQTRCPIRVTRVTAQLLGSRAELLATVAAAVFVPELRPGEPGPFAIEAPLPSLDIKTVEWHVDYEPAQGGSRLFEFSVYSEQVSSEYGYYLLGSIRNAAPSTHSVRIIAAWLDSQNRVLFADSPKISFIADSSDHPDFRDNLDLAGGDFTHFVYLNKDAELANLLGEARLVLWGTSK
jgi:hypothetical protein